MKRLILFELIIIFLATTFESDSPPGWFQQTIPVNKIINDIFFIDSSNGWAVTAKSVAGDTSFVIKTTNNGANWNVVYNLTNHLRVVQFLDLNTGYIAGGTVGGTAQVYKTTDGGINWSIMLSVLSGSNFRDIFFVNKDTGWVGDDNISGGAGLRKTTDGGLSWSQQLSGSFGPSKLFFINKDTGWAACQNTNLYRTTNGGALWTLQFTFTPFDNDIRSIFFINGNTGWTTHYTPSDTNGVYITTNGGFNWATQRGPDVTGSGMVGIYFPTIDTGYIAAQIILKTTNSGLNWFKQTSPSINYSSLSFTAVNTGWTSGLIVAHTNDGGGPPVGIIQTSNEVPLDYELFQNYPNPFNPLTNIKYSVKSQTSDVKLIVYDIQGKLVIELVNQKQNAGTYQADWNASGFSSGIYFYILIADNKIVETKKMILIK